MAFPLIMIGSPFLLGRDFDNALAAHIVYIDRDFERSRNYGNRIGYLGWRSFKGMET
jgi:hypothetical protein